MTLVFAARHDLRPHHLKLSLGFLPFLLLLSTQNAIRVQTLHKVIECSVLKHCVNVDVSAKR